MQRDREALYRPEVYAGVELEDAWLLFVVRNTGRSPAHNVTIKFGPCPIDRWGKRIDEVAFLHSPIKTLNPGSRLCKFLDTHVGFFEKSGVPRVFTVELHYESLSGTKYSIASIIAEQKEKTPNTQN